MVIAALLLAQAVPSPVTLGELRREIPADLRPAMGDVNAWKWVQLAGKLPRGGNSSTPRKEQIRALLDAWNRPGERDLVSRTRAALTEYQAPFAALDKALKFPHWGHPFRPDGYVPKMGDIADDTDFSVFAGLRSLAFASELQARLDLAQGKPALAEGRLLKARLLGERLCDMEYSDVSYLVGGAICSIAARSVHLFAQQGLLPIPALVRLNRHVLGYPIRLRATGASRGQLYGSSLLAFTLAKPPTTLGNLLTGHPNAMDRQMTMRWLVNLQRTEIANISGSFIRRADLNKRWTRIVNVLPPAFSAVLDGKPLSTAEKDSLRRDLLKINNPVGRYIVSLVAPIADFARGANIQEARQDLESLATAANIHKRRTGVWPTTLNDLTPADGLPKPLRDPLTESAYRYDRATLTVRSIALDDDGSPIRSLRVSIVLSFASPKANFMND